MRKQTLSLVVVFFIQTYCFSQYTENPLKDKKWVTLSAGLNTADNVSWQGCLAASMRGETMITQARLAYSQELIEAVNDTCTFRKNRLAEIGLMWGDGWAGKRWFVAGTVGFGFNVYMYCAEADYGGYRYPTAVTIGIPAHLELGINAGKRTAIALSVLGNWNFRQPYLGAHLGITKLFE